MEMEIEYFGNVTEDAKEEIQAFIEEKLVGSEFSVMTEKGRDEKVKSEIRESLWAFNTKFIIENSTIKNSNKDIEKAIEKMKETLCESANEVVLALLKDFDDFVENAVETDGHGHFLSMYDNEEHEFKSADGNLYFIYRQN